MSHAQCRLCLLLRPPENLHLILHRHEQVNEQLQGIFKLLLMALGI